MIELEGMTNDRIRDEVGRIELIPPADRISGPGTSSIMAAFTHPNPVGSRFSDGSYGVFYCANTLDAAIAETCHQRERFMLATRETKMGLDMRVYLTDLDGALHDIRGMQESTPELYDPDDYSAAQTLARRLRLEGSWGIVYDSVRYHSGECAAVFRPPMLSNCRQERHLCYVWDGVKISSIYEKRVSVQQALT